MMLFPSYPLMAAAGRYRVITRSLIVTKDNSEYDAVKRVYGLSTKYAWDGQNHTKSPASRCLFYIKMYLGDWGTTAALWVPHPDQVGSC